MAEFAIGDTVTITGTILKGSVGTVVYFDEIQGKYLVRIGGSTQDFYSPDEIEPFGK